MNRLVRTATTALAALATLAATLVTAAPAGAAPSPGAGLDAAKTAVAARIDKRLDALKGFESIVNGAGQLTAAHKAALTKLIDDQQSGLAALKTRLQAETTAPAVKADAQSMVYDYRVFILTGPKVRLTVAIDTELAVVTKLRSQPGADAAKLDAIAQSLQGKADTLLSLKPGPDGDAIRAQVNPIRTAAKTAHADLKALRKKK
ncbi:hypothetical protein [Dactylosporangium sp. CA-139066]|uniref:hypothetical protein n=1 Tax=Dactylosporangium sp. CA-139066 TaxID=3239930 RepID=UPI003D94557F